LKLDINVLKFIVIIKLIEIITSKVKKQNNGNSNKHTDKIIKTLKHHPEKLNLFQNSNLKYTRLFKVWIICNFNYSLCLKISILTVWVSSCILTQ
jgi:hypothetical protein